MLNIRLLQSSDIPPIAAAFVELGWDKPASQYEQYLSEQEAGQRIVLVAQHGLQNLPILDFAGYVTICWQSHYPPFREANILALCFLAQVGTAQAADKEGDSRAQAGTD